MPIRTQKRRVREPFPVPIPAASGIYKKIAYSFVGLTFIIIIAALWFSSVRATVLITAKREPTKVRVDATIARAPANGELVGRVVQGVFEENREFKATMGEGKTVTGTSKGRVKITNKYSSAQPLVKTTRLLAADGRLYRINAGVTVPAGGSVEVGAYADADGGTYDLAAAGVTFTVPGLSTSMQKFVTAENITPFAGGETVLKTVAADDLAKAEATLRDAAIAKAKDALQRSVNDPKFTDIVYVTSLVDKTSSVRAGDQADSFLMSVKMNVTGVFYARSDMETFVRDRVKDRVPDGREYAGNGQADMKTTFEVGSADAGTERAQIVATATVLTKPSSPDNLVSKEAIAGLPIGEAEDAVRNMTGVEDVQITIRPSWIHRLPTLKDHISIKVK